MLTDRTSTHRFPGLPQKGPACPSRPSCSRRHTIRPATHQCKLWCVRPSFSVLVLASTFFIGNQAFCSLISTYLIITIKQHRKKWDPHRRPEKRRSVSFFLGSEEARLPLLCEHELIILLRCCFLSTVIMKAVGGEIGSASALAPKLGPLGLVRWHCLGFLANDFSLLINCNCCFFFFVTVAQEGR